MECEREREGGRERGREREREREGGRERESRHASEKRTYVHGPDTVRGNYAPVVPVNCIH